MPRDPGPIVARIQRDVATPRLFELLADRLAPSDLQSLLLEVMRERSARRSPAQLLAQRRRDATVTPTDVDVRRLHAVEGLALDAAIAFTPVALSPVAPRGVNRVLADIDQNNALATVRNNEVLADPTTALALEAALRRADGEDPVRLCSVGRVLRLQPPPPGLAPHFGLFALASATRATGGPAAEAAACGEHVAVHLALLERLREAGGPIRAVGVAISDPRTSLVRDRVLEPLRDRFPDVVFEPTPDRRGGAAYYDGLRLDVTVEATDGGALSLVDGGLVDWTARLRSDRRERLYVSGLGTELAARLLA